MRIECSHKELVYLKDLKECPSNRNIHNQKQIEILAKIIARNGQRSPIVVSNLSGLIVKGHCRKKAIELLGWEKCAVDFQDYKDEVEELRDRISDNEIARYAEFDRGSFLVDLKELDFDLADLDFEEFGLKDFNFEFGENNKIENVNTGDEKSEWVGMPEFNAKDKPLQIIINFENEKDRGEFVDKSCLEFVKKQGNTWTTCYPLKERDDLGSLKYE